MALAIFWCIRQGTLKLTRGHIKTMPDISANVDVSNLLGIVIKYIFSLGLRFWERPSRLVARFSAV